jgi:hypothetical protein
MSVDTSSSKFIPREVALEKLKEILPAVDVLGCTLPKSATWAGTDVREWKIDGTGVTFHAPPREPLTFAYAAVTSTRMDRLGAYYQVRIFTAEQADPKKDHYHFNFRSETSARQVLELLEALRQKK